MVLQVSNWLTPRQFLELHKGKLGRNTLYEHIRDKTVPSVRLGRKILIPADALERMLETGSRES